MFAYPPQTAVNRVLPKSKIYGHSKASRALQERFAREVDKIVWRHKLAEESVNLPATGTVREIQVFDLLLKEKELSEDVLRAIDRTIRHPIAFQVLAGDQVRYAMAHKRSHEGDSNKWVVEEYFWTVWAETEDELPALPVVTNMQALYESILGNHLPLQPRKGEGLQEQVERITTWRKKQREATKLQSKLAKTKQFNRKVEINQAVKSLRDELIVLGGDST